MTLPTLSWRWFSWNELNVNLLYEVLQLRSAIFVVEQNCVFLEMDGIDCQCDHLCGFDEAGAVLAYARLVPPGVKFVDPSIGRVVTHARVRGSGVGRKLMQEAVAGCMARFPGQAIGLGAQQHLEHFYGSLGFCQYGESYLEDGIPHIDMRREA